jgi:starvation-inducible DNA-binding protein
MTKAKSSKAKKAATEALPVSPLYASLSKLLADEMVLYTKLRKYHWNVTGPNFQSLHLLFEQQYTELAVMIDDLAEFIRTLRAPAIGTMQEFLEHARLTEQPGVNPSANAMVTELAEDHTKIIGYLHETIEEADDLDAVAAEDLLTQMLRAHEKSEWMLRATIE